MLSNETKRTFFGFLSSWLATPLLKGLALTQTYTVYNVENLRSVSGEEDNFILALWHGQILPTLFYFAESEFDQTTFYTFISPHRDGEYISRVASGLGINALRTSRRDPRLSALKKIHRLVNDGKNLAITPDGPVGPPFQVNPGVVKLSRRFDRPILPVAAVPTAGKYFSSWDRLVLPFPLATIHVLFGPVKRFSEQSSLEAASRELQDTLNRLTLEVSSKIDVPRDVLDELP